MAAATKTLRCVFSVVFVVNLSIFTCLSLEIVYAENEETSRGEAVEMLRSEDHIPETEHREPAQLKAGKLDEGEIRNPLASIQEDSSGETTEKLFGSQEGEMDIPDATANIISGSNSAAPVDYIQLLASYMRPEVFQRFIKGLNKTLDAHTQYSHPDFTYANTTEKDGAQQRKIKYPCMHRPPGNRTAQVRIVNSTELMEIVSIVYKAPNQDNSSSVLGGYCAFVMFFAPWCKFSAAAAPAFNAIGRAFPDLEVLAVDAFKYNSLNTRYGIVAVPNILLFHNNKPVMRFNYTQRTFEVFTAFIRNFTGLEPNSSIQLSNVDFLGPLPSVATEEPDYALWFSCLLLVSMAVWFLKERLGSAITDRVRTFAVYARQVWRTGEFYDQVGVLVHEHHD